MTSKPAHAFPHISPLGLDGLLVRFADRFDDAANRAALVFRADARALAGVCETSTSLCSVYLRFDPAAVGYASLIDQTQTLLASRDWYSAPLPAQRRIWQIPTVYGEGHGPHLAQAAEMAGVPLHTAIEDLSAARLRVMAIGFAPGFPYLGHLPPHWDLPRQANLNTTVPAGALCLAIRQCVLFPGASPTGWHHIGTTAFRSFRPDAQNPFVLHPGDEICFPAVPARDLPRLHDTHLGGATCEQTP